MFSCRRLKISEAHGVSDVDHLPFLIVPEINTSLLSRHIASNVLRVPSAQSVLLNFLGAYFLFPTHHNLRRVTAEMADETVKRRCSGLDCQNDAGSLQCPTCLKIGKESIFCSQDCFKRSWVGFAFTRCYCTLYVNAQKLMRCLERTQSSSQNTE